METVIGSVVTKLRATTGLTALVASIYNNVPQNTPYPYLEVTSPTDRPVDTYGRFGSTLLVDVKAVSQYHGDREAAQIMNEVQRALQFQPLNTTGHATLGVTLEGSERFRDVVQGIVTRYHVNTFRVWTEQSTS